ncbi:transcription factor BIM1-like isoform X1 [Nicotiana tabacum]|uniref:Transcription factor BIM1-like isoform X1 n=2 Tax=Nicotiana TaxID=4085 RepID=A0A1S4DKY6_TOBAC|nr:PREDICTED: transcription factor BIM1 isoform X1 [Nicotiana sylvestris]XP_016514051.1 PREDICTED: transcription factor BIM1-like isoform X1 [Nicotiana tabacum]
MELPQPRPFGTEGRKTTHDFLSLYSPVQQDPTPPQAGGFLKTHDFLQPLEQAEKALRKEEAKVEVVAVEKPPAPVASPSVEHILPGGIGTYSISYLHQRIPKPEASLFAVAQATSTDRNDENSNCSSYTGGSGFTLWDESAVKGKTGKENSGGDRHALREAGLNTGGGQPTTSLEWQSQSSSNHKHNTTAISSLSSARQSSPLKTQSFVHMITSAKNAQDDDDDDDEDFVIKKEPQSHPRGNLSVKVDGEGNDKKPNTPRSKHSATEQRRRSKINDRFQMLRGIIPNSDQKRDKASFLLEVIEYIHFLQEKVHKYEESYQGWENEPLKLPLSKCHRTTQGASNHPQGTINASGAAPTYAVKFDENIMGISSTNPFNAQKVEPNISTTSLKESSQRPGLTNKATTPSMSPNTFPFCGASTAALYSSKLTADTAKLESKSHPQFSVSRSHMTDYAIPNANSKGQDLSIESGTISISSAYSQGLLNTLTLALQNSGVDLSQANISVQIDLGKRANGRLHSSASTVKGDDVSTSNQPIPKSISTSTREESDRAFKRLKTS